MVVPFTEKDGNFLSNMILRGAFFVKEGNVNNV